MLKKRLVALVIMFASALCFAENPIIDHMYSADPSAHVWDGKVWLYPSHDQDDARNYTSMDGHHVFSSSDLVNWTDHGEIMHTDNLPWANSGYLWAPDAAYKNGTYYYYYPVQLASDGTRSVGVATSDTPYGPFTDQGAIEGVDSIDPAVFIDDDGKAYLFWGSHYLRWAELNEDMTSIGEVHEVPVSETPNYKEGPWVHKRNGIYYMSYAHSGVRAPLLYATSDSPAGPWTYQGELMDAENTGGWTNHHSIVEFKGQAYLFYHNTALSTADLGEGVRETYFRRSVCIDELYYNADGTIQKVIQTTQGVGPILDSGDNIAQGKTATQSTTAYGGAASRAVDGNTNGAWNNGSVTHTDAGIGSWWQVDLDGNYSIGDITVWNRTDTNPMSRLSNYTVQVLDASGTPVWESYQTEYPDPSTTVNAGVILGSYVRILQNSEEPLSLAEVEVYQNVSANLAEGKVATQSSTAYGGIANRALDGDTNGTWANGSVTHTETEGSGAWWKVDLGASYDLSNIVVWSRTNTCCITHLSDYTVQVLDGDGFLVWESAQITYPDPNTVINTSGVFGRYVTIVQNGPQALSLAEVQVFGN